MTKVNYPVGDFLIRIKNISRAGKRELVVPKTKLVKAVAQVLKKEGYLEGVVEEKGQLFIKLAYRRKKPVIMDLELVSRPGLRIYKKVEELEKMRGPSILILTTSKGIVSSREAIKTRMGGEVIARIL